MFNRLGDSFNQMVDELQRNDQQRRNLTADIAHELRTPIHVIQGNLEGIIDGVYQPDEETIHQLLDETNRLSRLVEDLHTLSLAEGGELPLSLETVHLAEIFEDVVTSFSGQAASAGITLRADASPKLTVHADPGRLVQVLSNLVVNALRHTPEGGIISLDAVPIEGGLRITVTDTGVGIPPENLPYIFDRLWRGDRSRAREDHTSGYGLGLPIARQLVRAHGGELTAQSEIGKGSTFTIELL
jgi:two-component system OmpR family sensor kinase/two-component system sensor histidine kinase BaeS